MNVLAFAPSSRRVSPSWENAWQPPQPPPLRGLSAPRRRGPWSLDLGAVVRFNVLVHDVHPQAPWVDVDRLMGLARWWLSQPPHAARSRLNDRLAPVATMRQALNDPQWRVHPSFERRFVEVLRYIDDDRALVPPRVPALEHVDEALLLELTWPSLADELADYQDYCRFRDEEAGGEATPEQWLAARHAQAARYAHERAWREQPYASQAPWSSWFRVV